MQASKHEGFGVSVAEAMLAGCVPVTTRAGALPEVVGDTGVLLDDSASADGRRWASARRCIWARPRSARRRVLERFSVEQRRDGLFALLDELLPRRAS